MKKDENYGIINAVSLAIVDDYIFYIQYVEADKDLYYQKQEAERKANLLAAAQINHSTSSDLINIYFQPCCDKYEYTEILLYIPQEENFKGWTGDGRKVVEILSWSMIKNVKCLLKIFINP